MHLRCVRSSAPPTPSPPAISPRRSSRSRRQAARRGPSSSMKTSIRGRTRRWKTCKSSNPSCAIPAPSPPAMRPASTTALPPRIMGIGPVPSTRKLMERLGLKITDFDLIELNEAFASQGIAVLRQLGVAEDADYVNPHGGAIALGHPLGMSGARLTLTAVHGLEKRGGKRALATMCVGVGQGVSLALEKV